MEANLCADVGKNVNNLRCSSLLVEILQVAHPQDYQAPLVSVVHEETDDGALETVPPPNSNMSEWLEELEGDLSEDEAEDGEGMESAMMRTLRQAEQASQVRDLSKTAKVALSFDAAFNCIDALDDWGWDDSSVPGKKKKADEVCALLLVV